MGRWISKPFKRWAFAKGVQFTKHFSAQYVNKYMLKYLRKQAKNVAGVALVDRQDQRSSIMLSQKVCAHASGPPHSSCAISVFDPPSLTFL
jgi:hypothetical protein